MAGEKLKYIEALTEVGEETAAALTGTELWGGAVAYRAQPCLVLYGTPVWIMPNGMCRVGYPDAPMVTAERAVEVIKLGRSVAAGEEVAS